MEISRSIRSRLLAGILFSLVVILAVAAWASYSVARHEAEEIFSARLATLARVLQALVARQVEHATVARPFVIELPRELEMAGNEDASPLGHPYETRIAFQVWREDGQLLARSASAPSQPFGPHAGGFSRQTINGEEWQVFVLQSNTTSIQVAEKNEFRDDLVHDLGLAVMTPLVGGAALLLIVVNLLIIFGLSPLSELAGRIEARDPEALEHIELKRMPRELATVVQSLNSLLTRVKLAFERERRFTDAAAHELRTPLAALNIHAENAMRAQAGAERAQSMQQLKLGLDRTIKLTEQMLSYSRAQNGADPGQRETFRLSGVVAEAIAAVEPLRESKSQRINLSVDDAAWAAVVSGEPEKIQSLVRNLLDNASRYAPRGSDIDVSLSIADGALTLTVTNPGKPIPAELRERVFEPYFRIAGTATEGSGLGLAIVREIARQHGAKLELTTMPDGQGTVIAVTFPGS